MYASREYIVVQMAQTLSLVIVGENDTPLYHADLSGRHPDVASKDSYRHHFVLHAALDSVDILVPSTRELYLKTVDRFNNLLVSAFITPGDVRFLLLHEGKHEDPVRNFFMEIYEAHLKVMLNPFHTTKTKITSKEFDKKIRSSAKKYF